VGVRAPVADPRSRRVARVESGGTRAVSIDREPVGSETVPSERTAGRTALPERNLDVLRAVAVMLVVSTHLLGVWIDKVGPLTVWHLGRIGVLVFFVHTSLVLMASLERLEAAGERPARLCLAFYVRRAFRIYPLAIACILGYVFFRVPGDAPRLAHPAQFIAPTPRELLANLALVQDLVGVRFTIGVLWSLPVEVQMYLLLPFCYFAAKRGVRYVIGLFALAVIGWSAVGVFHLPGTWRLSVLNFGPCFVAGVMAYALLRKHPARRLPGWTWPLLLAACVPALWLTQADDGTPERGWLFCVAVAACIPLVRELPRSWLTRVASVIATYSYGIYLTHVAAIWVAFVALSAKPLVTRWLAFMALAVGLPFLAYHAIERPMIALGIRISQRFRTRGSAMTEAAAVAPVP
jgi:peptidoglycan/LPS O-acetylase OafA/YrhL